MKKPRAGFGETGILDAGCGIQYSISNTEYPTKQVKEKSGTLEGHACHGRYKVAG